MCSHVPVCVAILHAKFCTVCSCLIFVTDALDRTVEEYVSLLETAAEILNE